MRGGSWLDFAVVLRCSLRDVIIPDDGSDVIGFRVVRSQSKI